MFPTSQKDINEKVLLYLPDKDLVKWCEVNKKANEICKSDNFWFKRVTSLFPYIPIDILRKYKGNRSWSEYYIEDMYRINKLRPPKYSWDDDDTDTDDYFDVVKNDRLDLILIMLNNNIDDEDVSTIMTLTAAAQGKLDLVKYLINNGYAEQGNPLIPAVSQGHKEVTEYLMLLNKYDISERWKRYARIKGHEDVANLAEEYMRNRQNLIN